MSIIKKDVKYLNKDFGKFRKNLIDFTKNYFPNTYNDFNESSPGMMFMEMASYVGDVLSFYTDTQLRESLMSQVQERSNLYTLSQVYGYKPKTVTPANVKLDVYQLLPAVGSGADARPDYRYALSVKTNMEVSNINAVKFRSLDSVDFQFSSSASPSDISVYEVDDTGNITYYLLKKQVNAVSGELKTSTFAFADPKVYDKIVLPDANVVDIVSVTDVDGNAWTEVDYLAQETIMNPVENISFNSPATSQHRSTVPYLMCLKRVPRRFITRLRQDGLMELQFGSGLSTDSDEDIIPNPTNVGMGLSYLDRSVSANVDPTNFLYTKTYGLAPSNTTLTVKYSLGKGVSDNVALNTINTVDVISFATAVSPNLDNTVMSQVQASVAVNNPEPATGGALKQNIENIRQDAMATFASQNRVVTKEDYIARCYSMPAKYGAVQKAFIVQDEQIESNNPDQIIPNPLALNLYTLGYDQNKNFVGLNSALKENLKTYLSQFRVMTDAINIKTAYIINIGIEFEIITVPNANSNEVILRCIKYLKDTFNNDNQQINEPINISTLMSALDRIKGVQTVVELEFVNLFDTNEGYSGNVYDINTATKNKTVYPSMDPAIFEIKYPDKDIKGRVVTF